MEKKIEVHSPCPNCQKPLQIISLGCTECTLELRGPIQQAPLLQLNEEQTRFLYLFVQCEGKISDMEKALGISYPTVKNRLSELKKSMSHFSKSKPQQSSHTMAILAQIEQGQLDFETGLKMIKNGQQEET